MTDPAINTANHIDIYHTDGSASPNPGPGGYAVILNQHPIILGVNRAVK